jgi:chemotaxis response regulator CheB
VQDEASSVVFGMPKAALDRGAAELALPPRELALALARLWSGGGR